MVCDLVSEWDICSVVVCNTRCAVRKKEGCVDSGRCGSSSLVKYSSHV